MQEKEYKWIVSFLGTIANDRIEHQNKDEFCTPDELATLVIFNDTINEEICRSILNQSETEPEEWINWKVNSTASDTKLMAYEVLRHDISSQINI